MKTSLFLKLAPIWVLAASGSAVAQTVIIDFFDPSQSFSLYQSDVTSDTALTEGYLFTYTRDKFWSPVPGGPPTGRFVSVDWPVGLQAQAVTAGPSPGPAKFTIRRQDGTAFDMPEFTFKLLANTAGAGGAVEIMPKLNGEDAFADPVTFNATGIAGNSFTYNTTTPVFLGNTSPLVGFDTYQVSLYVDFAFTDVKLNGDVPEPSPTAFLLGGLAGLLCTRQSRYCVRTT